MKHIFTFIIIAVTVLSVGSNVVTAQSPTAKTLTPTAAPSDIINKLKQIQILKEKIATKVAEIREKEKRAYSGVVKTIDQSAIIISKNGIDKTASLSEDTLFYNLTKDGKTEIAGKSIKVGSFISVFGYTSEGNSQMAVKYIFSQTSPILIIGKIADMDKENYTLTVRERQGNQLVDIETYTKNFVFTKERGKQKIGFSKLKIGDTVHVVGTANIKEANRVTAGSLLVLPFTPQTTLSPTPAKEATASTTPKVTSAK